jgi:hypothetical protein
LIPVKVSILIENYKVIGLPFVSNKAGGFGNSIRSKYIQQNSCGLAGILF